MPQAMQASTGAAPRREHAYGQRRLPPAIERLGSGVSSVRRWSCSRRSATAVRTGSRGWPRLGSRFRGRRGRRVAGRVRARDFAAGAGAGWLAAVRCAVGLRPLQAPPAARGGLVSPIKSFYRSNIYNIFCVSVESPRRASPGSRAPASGSRESGTRVARFARLRDRCKMPGGAGIDPADKRGREHTDDSILSQRRVPTILR